MILTAVPPHMLMGFTLAEIAALLTVIGVLITAVGWVFNHWILIPALEPIKTELQKLNNLLDRMSARQDTAEKEHEKELDEHERRINDHSKRLDRLEIQAARHDEILKREDSND